MWANRQKMHDADADPSVPGSTSPSPRGYGECPARTSWPWEPRPATDHVGGAVSK